MYAIVVVVTAGRDVMSQDEVSFVQILLFVLLSIPLLLFVFLRTNLVISYAVIVVSDTKKQKKKPVQNRF